MRKIVLRVCCARGRAEGHGVHRGQYSYFSAPFILHKESCFDSDSCAILPIVNELRCPMLQT